MSGWCSCGNQLFVRKREVVITMVCAHALSRTEVDDNVDDDDDVTSFSVLDVVEGVSMVSADAKRPGLQYHEQTVRRRRRTRRKRTKEEQEEKEKEEEELNPNTHHGVPVF